MKEFILIFLVCISSARAQTVVTDIEDPFIEVTGIAEMEVIPDEIFISICLKERFIEKEKITIGSQEAILKEKIQSIGISPENLRLTAIRSEEISLGKHKKELIGQNDYLLKVTDPNLVDKLFRELETANIKEAHIEKLNNIRLEEFKKDVKLKAVQSAKLKAEQMLASIGEVPGKPIFIIEDVGDLIIDTALKEANFLKIKLSYKVRARFEIE